MEDFSTHIEKLITMMIPFIIMGNSGLSYYLLPLMYICPLICKWITKKFSVYVSSEYNYTVYEYDDTVCINRQTRNKQFMDVGYLICKHDLLQDIKSIECKSYTDDIGNVIYSEQNSTAYNIIPCTTPSKETQMNFVHENINVDIIMGIYENKSEKQNIDFYKITAKNSNMIKKFVKYLSQIEIERAMSIKKEPNYLYYYYSEKQGGFVSNNINVTKTFDNIFLDEKIKTKLIHNIEYFINNKKQYDALGIQRKIGYLLYGVPGNGKTSIAIAIARSYNKNIFKVDMSVTRETFFNQIQRIPKGSVVLMEDIDTFSVTHERSMLNDNSDKNDPLKMALTLGNILEVLDGYYYLNECIIIMTTNHVEKLDSALIRPGRIDHKLELSNISKEQIVQIIKYFYGKNIKSSTLNKLNINVSVSELINTIIIPNLGNYDCTIDYLLNGNNQM